MELKLGLNKCTNEEYHEDRKFYSSSVLKLILKDKISFYEHYIKGKPMENKSGPALALGTYIHTMILEPELLDKECVVLPSNIATRRGAEYEKFKAFQPGKTIITQKQKELADTLHKVYQEHPLAQSFLQGGVAEQSLCVKMDGVPIKVRADYVNVDKGYIVDIKTTSDATDRASIIHTNEKWEYPLSAALYCKAFSSFYNKKFDFYWIYLSKFYKTCDIYKMSLPTMKKGLEQVKDALTIYKKNAENDSWYNYEVEEV